MRLANILTEDDGDEHTKTIAGIPVKTVDYDFLDAMRNNDSYEEVGSGVYAVVFAEHGVPGVVHKVSRLRTSPLQDGYVRFLRIVLHHRDNPFLPKIYDAMMYYNTETHQYTLHATMENLHRLGTFKLHDVAAYLWDQLGVDASEVDVTGFSRFGAGSVQPWDPGFEKVHPDFFTKDDERINKKTSLYWWIKQGENFQFMLDYADNEHAKTALRVALNAARGEAGQLDLHTGNWMIRLTSVGPQLVITDPVA